MDFLELTKNRFSLRKFSDKKVEKEKIDYILAAMQAAPTAVNFQPQRILVLTDEKELEKVSKCTKFAFNPPLNFLVCYDKETSWTRGNDGHDEGEIDAAIVATHMMLAAKSVGLGTTWVGSFNPKDIKEQFNLPENYVPVAFLPTGYPSDDAEPSAAHSSRKDLNETVFYNSFFSKNNKQKGVCIMKICVFGASSSTIDKSYVSQVEELGRKIADRGHGLVYGAGASGLMGAVARGVYEKKGEIVGVVPNFFDDEDMGVDGRIFQDCTELIRTDTMRERKRIMEERADAFVIVPGGIGTFEEFFEVFTLKQLERHNKAIAILNVNGYYNAMIDMLEVAVKEKFLRAGCKLLYKVFDDVDETLAYN